DHQRLFLGRILGAVLQPLPGSARLDRRRRPHVVGSHRGRVRTGSCADGKRMASAGRHRERPARSLLSHVLLGRTVPSAWGDAVFGYAVYVVFVCPDIAHFLLFALMTVSSAVIFVAFGVITASLTFYIGNGSFLAEQWRFSMLTFATYPEPLFCGIVKIVLFTAIPAGFVSYVPVRALRDLSLLDAAFAIAGAVMVAACAVVVFYTGLQRY